MQPLRRAVLLSALLAGPWAASADTADKAVKDEAANFEIAVPPEKATDWDELPTGDRKDLKAHFKTEFTDTEPLAWAEVQVILTPLKKDLATRGLDAIAGQWAMQMEGCLTSTRDLKEGKATLGGQEAYFRDVKGDYQAGAGPGHVTWYVTRMGKFVYVLYVLRTFKAVDDKGLEEEIGKIRDSFKFLKIEEVKADPKAKDGLQGPAGGGASATKGPDPELLVREELKFDHWKLKLVKPEGLLSVPPDKFDKSETDNHVIVKLSRQGEQTNCLIRVYAQLEKTQRYTIDQLAETTIKYFNQKYNEKSRKEPEVEKDYKKFPLAKDAIKMKLVGRRTVPEVSTWYFAQCKNGRQYQIEIYLTGAEGEQAWKNQVDDFMKNFKPQDD